MLPTNECKTLSSIFEFLDFLGRKLLSQIIIIDTAALLDSQTTILRADLYLRFDCDSLVLYGSFSLTVDL